MARIKSQLRTYTQVSLASAGVAQQVSVTSQQCKALILQADAGNLGTIYIGESDVSGTKCLKMAAGEHFSIVPDESFADEDIVYIDLSEIYINGTNTGDKINIAVLDLATVSYTGG